MTSSVLEDQKRIMAKASESVGKLLRKRAQDTPNRQGFLVPDYADGPNAWTPKTWGEVYDEVCDTAAGLINLGLQPGQCVAIAASTRYEWVIADLAIQCAGGVTTTVYPNTNADEEFYILNDSDSSMIFAGDWSQVAKVVGHDELDSRLSRIIMIVDDRGDHDEAAAISASLGDRLTTFDDLQRAGGLYRQHHPDCVEARIDATGADDLSTLIYTSGTTGTPKGVELVHRCWTYLAASIEDIDLVFPDEIEYLWLPLSHVFGKALIAVQLHIGFCAAVDGRIDRIVKGLSEVRPTIMCGAPRIFEKVRAAMLTGATSRGIKGRIARWAFAVGRDSRPYRLAGDVMPRGLRWRYQLADKLVFSKLKQAMGGRVRFFISGSAKLSKQVQEWFYSAGIVVIEGYGMTETTAVAFLNHARRPRFGTVGKATVGLEHMIADDGEILLRGPSIARGYHHLSDKTIYDEDGWFHTGDVGFLDPEGCLTITDRKKDLMKTSGGKYVAPQKVESAILANVPYVSQAVAVGDGRKYVVALLTLDRDALTKWGEKRGLEADYAELSQHPDVRASIAKLMEKANSTLERWETVKNFAILDHELDVESGDLTASMKVKRQAVIKSYTDTINSLYPSDDGSVVTER